MSELLRESKVAHVSRVRPNSGMKQSRVVIEGNSMLDNSKNEQSFNPLKTQLKHAQPIN